MRWNTNGDREKEIERVSEQRRATIWLHVAASPFPVIPYIQILIKWVYLIKIGIHI